MTICATLTALISYVVALGSNYLICEQLLLNFSSSIINIKNEKIYVLKPAKVYNDCKIQLQFSGQKKNMTVKSSLGKEPITKVFGGNMNSNEIYHSKLLEKLENITNIKFSF